MAAKRTKVETEDSTPGEPTRREVYEQLLKIERALHDVRASGLNQHAIVILVAAYTRLPKRTCLQVLEGLQNLKAEFTVPPKKRR